MHDLEHIPFDAVVRPDGTRYTDFRRSLHPRYGKAWKDIGLGFFLLALLVVSAGLLAGASLTVQLMASLLLAPLVGFVLAYLALFLHEGGHFNLHSNKRTNDRLTDATLGVLFGISIKAYRKIHWQHHLHLGTVNDTETSYFHALTSGFLLETFTGIHLLRTLGKKNNSISLTPEMRRKSRRMLLLGGAFHCILLVLFFVLGATAALVSWTLGMLLLFPFFATIRQLLEHRDETAAASIDYTLHPDGKLTRLFDSGWFSRAFGGAGFNKHMIHHWDPQLSYTRMEEVESFLLQCEATRQLLREKTTSYTAAFKKLMRAPS